MKRFLKLLILPISIFNLPIKSLEINALEKKPQIKGITFETKQLFEFVEPPKLKKFYTIPRQETNTNLF